MLDMSPTAAEAPQPPPSTALEPAKPTQPRTRNVGHPTYTCPMHPEVRSPAPGRCPKCGMTLVPMAEGSGAAEEGHAH